MRKDESVTGLPVWSSQKLSGGQADKLARGQWHNVLALVLELIFNHLYVLMSEYAGPH
jgi:hypothetical protein